MQPAYDPSMGPRDPSELRCWHLEGKIAVRDPEDSGSAYVRWRQSNRAYELDISGPLGTGAAAIYGDGSRVVMRLSEDKVIVSRTPEALLRTHFGWEVPISGLNWWARGLAIPGAPHQLEKGPDGRPVRLQQEGWDVQFLEYESHIGYPLPVKLELNQGERRVRMRIRDWQPHNCELHA